MLVEKDQILRLHHLLKWYISYNPDTGIFKWKRGPRRGKEAGNLIDGYLRVGIENKEYRLHRVAWLYMTGKWPVDQIDHINRIRNDNRWCNLREANNSQQQGNILSKNSLGRGVTIDGHRYRARITIQNKKISLGTFSTKEEAVEVYNKKAKEHYGDFYVQDQLQQS